MLLWLSVQSEVQIVCVWSVWCQCHPKPLSSLASFKSRLVLPFWYQVTQVFLEKRPLNGSVAAVVNQINWKWEQDILIDTVLVMQKSVCILKSSNDNTVSLTYSCRICENCAYCWMLQVTRHNLLLIYQSNGEEICFRGSAGCTLTLGLVTAM